MYYVFKHIFTDIYVPCTYIMETSVFFVLKKGNLPLQWDDLWARGADSSKGGFMIDIRSSTT